MDALNQNLPERADTTIGLLQATEKVLDSREHRPTHLRATKPEN